MAKAMNLVLEVMAMLADASDCNEIDFELAIAKLREAYQILNR